VYLLRYLPVTWVSGVRVVVEAGRPCLGVYGRALALVSSEVRGTSSVRTTSDLGFLPCFGSPLTGSHLPYMGVVKISHSAIVANVCHILCHLGYVGFPSG